MSQAPHLLWGAREGIKMGDITIKDAMVHDGLWCAFDRQHMGMTGEVVADKFGANLREVELGLLEQEEIYDGAKQSFIDADLNSADSTLSQVSTSYDVLTDLAFDLWNRAIFWVFVSEWLAVTGTSMVAGYVLWTLMVKRRLYREVSETRMSPMDR